MREEREKEPNKRARNRTRRLAPSHCKKHERKRTKRGLGYDYYKQGQPSREKKREEKDILKKPASFACRKQCKQRRQSLNSSQPVRLASKRQDNTAELNAQPTSRSLKKRQCETLRLSHRWSMLRKPRNRERAVRVELLRCAKAGCAKTPR